MIIDPEMQAVLDDARHQASVVRRVAGGGAAARAIIALADSVERLARLRAGDRRHGDSDRRVADGGDRQQRSLGRRRTDPER